MEDDHKAMFFLRAWENIGCRWEFMGSGECARSDEHWGELAAIKINLNIYKIVFPL
jgi:hypothetical protein